MKEFVLSFEREKNTTLVYLRSNFRQVLTLVKDEHVKYYCWPFQ